MGGGHCKSVIDTLAALNRYSRITITYEILTSGTDINGIKVVGTDSVLPKLMEDGYEEAFITVGSIKSTAVRKKSVEPLRDSALGFL